MIIAWVFGLLKTQQRWQKHSLFIQPSYSTRLTGKANFVIVSLNKCHQQKWTPDSWLFISEQTSAQRMDEEIS